METIKHLYHISHSTGLIMRNVSDRSCTENQHVHFMFENHGIYEIMWENTAEPDRPQMICVHTACWITKARIQMHPQYIMLTTFHSNNGFVNTRPCYICKYIKCLVVSLQKHYDESDFFFPFNSMNIVQYDSKDLIVTQF